MNQPKAILQRLMSKTINTISEIQSTEQQIRGGLGLEDSVFGRIIGVNAEVRYIDFRKGMVW